MDLSSRIRRLLGKHRLLLSSTFAAPVGRRAFTVLELVIVIAIVLILAASMFPVVTWLRARAQRAQCTANLRNLYLASDLFIQQNGSWPQINTATNKGKTDEEIANLWISALESFGVGRKTWICPTMQDSMQNPDYTNPADARIDYIATPFDDKPTSPHEWPRQPWFIESGNVHGSGNLIIFADGSVSDLNTVVGKRRTNH